MDQLLTVAAASIEFGVPACLAVSCVRQPQFRQRTIVVLGATTPLLLAYIYITVSYLFAAKPGQDDLFAVHAVWIMSFAAFLASVALGAVVALSPRPTFLVSRFLVGLASPFLLVSLTVL